MGRALHPPSVPLRHVSQYPTENAASHRCGPISVPPCPRGRVAGGEAPPTLFTAGPAGKRPYFRGGGDELPPPVSVLRAKRRRRNDSSRWHYGRHIGSGVGAAGIATLASPSEISGGALSQWAATGLAIWTSITPSSPLPPEPFPAPLQVVISLFHLSRGNPTFHHRLILLSSPPPCGRATGVCPPVASLSSGSAPIPPLHAVKGELRHFFPGYSWGSNGSCNNFYPPGAW